MREGGHGFRGKWSSGSQKQCQNTGCRSGGQRNDNVSFTTMMHWASVLEDYLCIAQTMYDIGSAVYRPFESYRA